MKKFLIDTLGCQMNKSDTEKIVGMLSCLDWEQTREEKEADLFLVNTCAIRQLSVDKAYSRIGNWAKYKKDNKKQNKNIKIAMLGCVSKLEGKNLFKKFPYLNYVIAPNKIYELPDVLNSEDKICLIDDDNEKTLKEFDFDPQRQKGINAWLTIMEGCNNFCSYCVVPYTRGREKSRTINAVINEAKEILNQGYKEITLLGQNVDSYGKNLEDGSNFAKLLKRLDDLEGNFRIRFTSSYPTDITDEVIETVKNSKHICQCFHIPMQSGNNRILKEMNRRYDVNQYKNIVQKIRNEIKNVSITSDFIAGFPSETEEEFLDTVKIIDELKLDYCNTAAYSPRPITKAGKMTEFFIDEETKKRRLQILNDKVKEASLKSNEKYVGKILEILIDNVKDGVYQGRTGNNKAVHLTDNKEYKIGDFVNVKMEHAGTWCMFGKSV